MNIKNVGAKIEISKLGVMAPRTLRGCGGQFCPPHIKMHCEAIE